MSVLRLRRWTSIAQMLYKCFVLTVAHDSGYIHFKVHKSSTLVYSADVHVSSLQYIFTLEVWIYYTHVNIFMNTNIVIE